MNKLTRRFKKKRKNKTFKGGSDTDADRPVNVEPLKEGVHAVGNVVKSVNSTVGDGVGWVKDTASEAVVGTTNFFADKANNLGNSMIAAIANKVQEHIEWLRPQDHLQRATSGYEGMLHFMNANDNSHLLKEFFRVNDVHDEYRKESFEAVFTEYKDLRSYATT